MFSSISVIYIVLASLLSSTVTNAQLVLQPAPNCGLPADPKCLVMNAQYTVVGTVMSNTLGQPGSTPTNYNATIAIRCVWASFTSPMSPGLGLAGQQVTVANWGFPKTGCPANTGSDAAIGANRIFFLYVAAPAPQGQGPDKAVYAVQDMCVGGVEYNSPNVNTVANVLNQYPNNAVATSNIGGANCTLPVSTTGTGSGGTSGNPAPTAPVTVPSNGAVDGGSVQGRLVSIVIAVMAGMASLAGL
ncbi:hypothetical protein BASA50_006511 [Batrachochytrium salamandrivorans]|uniref:Uncharacterized protein n=1 Tax=Batrachochytrium salamandrivorans TaxID=1357716 RepID=A0ABQ8FAY3_9FUNG|nr:hypothetical protein BASA62_009254 [Batrachochytrium salamandrivorans]KAH6580740.1 hypothetical protein BASA60_002745 [Batrachochytrium salamandrivorans]KAH6594561.1 hypothetical protein BASA50_006511 [Batrachochytrium salamandrivorans]KAH6601412.1 hypothetical protein BASA61_001974 [Batrachochytrium salamandrivorans]KAH9244275.1 hypothetical protein BASA81_018336 [Batrachochytrium salamandrivorans]